MGPTQARSPENPLDVYTTTSDHLSRKSASEINGIQQKTPYAISKASYKIINDDDLFYAPALVEGKVKLIALVGSGSVTCTLSESAECMLKDRGLI